jgi:hypothetical protein
MSVIPVRNGCDCCHQKRPWFMQHFLKPFSGTAGAGIIASQLFEQFFVAMHDAQAAFDQGFGGEALAPLAHDLKTSARFQIRYRDA